MRLKHQLFLVLLATSALLILLMFVISSWSFSRGFLGYINSAQQQQSQPLIEDVALRYEQSVADSGNGWAWVEDDNREWRQLLSLHGPSTRSDRRNRAEDSERTEIDLPPPRSRRGGPRGKSQHVLADSDKNILAGNTKSPDAISWMPVTSGDHVVGYVGIKTVTRLSGSLDTAFEYQQRNSFALAAVAMVLLSALVSIPLATWLVKPVLDLKSAITEVGEGNYSHRLQVRRKDEIADLGHGVNHLASTLETNREARRRWVAEISHELRTPVAVLQGELEAMQDGVREMDSAAVDSIHGEVRKLGHLIDDLHQLSQSDVGALEYRMAPLVIGELIESQLQLASASIDDAGLTLSLQGLEQPWLINADERRLSQLINNLLQNSVRYTDAPGTVHISLVSVDKHIVLTWEDSAPGVTQEELTHLFEPLYRAEQSRSRAYGGAGLGLSIATRIIQAHNGSIDATQSDYGGLKLVISLPVADAANMPA